MDLAGFIEIYDSVPPAYYAWMFERIKKYLADPVLEIGSGPGIMTGHLLQQGFRVTGLERNEEIFKRLQEMFRQEPRFVGVRGDVETDDLAALPGAPFGTVVCLNLLEHLEDDRRALLAFHRCLRPEGRLVVLVPAFPGLFGRMDELFGHRRRYRKAELEAAMRTSGFACRLDYFNSLGVLGWWWRFRVCRSERFSPSQNRVYERLIPVLKTMESWLHPPFGLSLIAVGEKR